MFCVATVLVFISEDTGFIELTCVLGNGVLQGCLFGQLRIFTFFHGLALIIGVIVVMTASLAVML